MTGFLAIAASPGNDLWEALGKREALQAISGGATTLNRCTTVSGLLAKENFYNFPGS
jgi:hypothetical protein